MENDYSSFMQKGEDGSITSFDEAKLGSYIDSLVSKGVDSYKAKAQKEAEMAKMSDQEKMTQQMADFEKSKADWENSMKAREREFVVRQAKSKLASNFSEAEIELLTKNITENEKESMKYVDSLIAERTKFLDESRKKIIEDLQSNQPTTTTQPVATSEESQTKVTRLTKQEIQNRYK